MTWTKKSIVVGNRETQPRLGSIGKAGITGPYLPLGETSHQDRWS